MKMDKLMKGCPA